MFRNVEYSGFDGQPELKARAEQLNPVLADEIRQWREDVEVLWSPAPGRSGLNLTLSLTLPTGTTGSALTTFRAKDLADEEWAVIRCGRAWSAVLGVLSKQLGERIREFMSEEDVSEPAEV